MNKLVITIDMNDEDVNLIRDFLEFDDTTQIYWDLLESLHEKSLQINYEVKFGKDSHS